MKKNISNQIWFVFEDSEIYNFIKGFDDVTDEWLDKAKPGNGNVIDANYFSEDNKNKYYVDGKNVVLDYSQQELEVAKWLIDTFGGIVYMLPRINEPSGIKTADYLWNNEKWDLKYTTSKSKWAIDYLVKNKQKQSNNFIIDISYSPLSIQEILFQIKAIYINKSRNWIDKIIIKNNKEIICVFIRKESDHNTNAS